MGALVLSGYLRILEDLDSIEKIIERIIFTVPPFMGSVEAMLNLIVGKSRLFNQSDDFRKVARTFPSIFELCPVYPGAISFDNEGRGEFDISDYGHWQQNSKHPNREEKARHFRQKLLNLKNVRKHNKLVYDLNILPDNLLSRCLILTGINCETLDKITVLDTAPDNDNIKNYFRFEKGNDHGDGTVHMMSSNVFKDKIKTISIESNWLETRIISHFIQHDWHSFFLNCGRVQNILKRFLEYDESELENEHWYKSIGDGVKLVI
jgi:hypothetical protein